jgi:hypothetical protein
MRRIPNAAVAAKRCVAPQRAPELRDAAHVHLKLLRHRATSSVVRRAARARNRLAPVARGIWATALAPSPDHERAVVVTVRFTARRANRSRLRGRDRLSRFKGDA